MAKILVVDDNAISQRLMSFILQQGDHTVVTAMNGVQAMEQLRETDVDLVLTDLMMPRMDGLTLLEHLRADERYKDLPVIALTASVKEQHHSRARAAGVDALLTKPIESEVIIDTVNRLVAQKHAYSA